MTEDEALLATIRGWPGEDAPRLAYADWLDEHADGSEPVEARARFIRLQIEVAQQARGLRRDRLDMEAESLLWRYYRGWLAPMREILEARLGTPVDLWSMRGRAGKTAVITAVLPVRGQRVCYCQWRRGFVDEVMIGISHFTTLAGEWLRRWPVDRFQTDCYPTRIRLAGLSLASWRWERSLLDVRGTVVRSELPPEIYGELDPPRSYRTVTAAKEALQEALMRCARTLVGRSAPTEPLAKEIP